MSSRATRPKQASAGRQGGGGGPRARAGASRLPSACKTSSASSPGRCSSQSGRQARTGAAGAAGPTSIPNCAFNRT
eukprot:3337237-Alexandrium_andersonii.AAC.1